MTTIEEQLALMDWLRANGGIGVNCGGEDDLSGHLPEYCQEERQEYLEYFEVRLRKADPAGERAYFAIRQAAKATWRDLHAEDYEGPVMQERVKAYFDAAATTGFAGPPELLGDTGSRCPMDGDNRKKRTGDSRIMKVLKRGAPWEWAAFGMVAVIALDFTLGP